jgi:hypothetical protein
MWETKSVNSILVDGRGQDKHRSAPQGRIVAFSTGDRIDFVSGEAGGAYGDRLNSFRRRILFVKPDLIVIHDTLEAPEPSTFDWLLHAAHPMKVSGREAAVEGKVGAARVYFLAPQDLRFSLTDRFDPPPRERVKLVQWHLTASTVLPEPAEEFITVIRPYGKGEPPPAPPVVEEIDGTYTIRATVPAGEAVVHLRRAGRDGGRSLEAAVVDASGEILATFTWQE